MISMRSSTVNSAAFCGFDDDFERVQGKLYVVFAVFDDAFGCAPAEFCQRRSPRCLHERAVATNWLCLTAFHWEHGEPKRVSAHGRNLQLHVADSYLQILLRGYAVWWPKKTGGANGSNAFQNVAAIIAIRHYETTCVLGGKYFATLARK